jgi:succinate dehydrogenase/fumarate reductase flavoprotein subunit
MEDEYDLTPTEKAKQVLVIGGGIAGCEAAISCKSSIVKWLAECERMFSCSTPK